MEGLHLIDHCSHLKMNLLLFDFAGAGHSEGDYVSLGWFESLDLAQVIEDARSRFKIGPLSIWGRSMGAVASILYAEKNQGEVSALVLDSPFSCLKGMIEQIGLDKFGMPSFVVKIAMKVISGTVHQKLGVNIFDLQPAKNAAKCNIPALFIVAKNDQILPPMSVMEIYNNYPATKKVIIHSADGGHSSEREPHIIARGFDLIGDQLMRLKIAMDTRHHEPNVYHPKKTQVFFDPFHSEAPIQMSHRLQDHTSHRIEDPFLSKPKQEAQSYSQAGPRPLQYRERVERRVLRQLLSAEALHLGGARLVWISRRRDL
jgi:alpha/beta superfamily hydrolase